MIFSEERIFAIENRQLKVDRFFQYYIALFMVSFHSHGNPEAFLLQSSIRFPVILIIAGVKK